MRVSRRWAWIGFLVVTLSVTLPPVVGHTATDPGWASPVVPDQALTAAEQRVLATLPTVGEARTKSALADIRTEIARELMAQGLHDNDPWLQKAALRYAAAAADLDAANPQRWVLLGLMYQAATFDPFAATEAEVAFLQALDLAPANERALLGLIQYRWERGRYAEVLEPLERLLSNAPRAAAQPVLSAQLAVAYIQTRELHRGITFFQSSAAAGVAPDLAKVLTAVLHGERQDQAAERALLEDVAKSGAAAYAAEARKMLEGTR